MQRMSLWVVVLAVLVVLPTSCGKKASETAAEKMIESAMRAEGQKADVTINSETMQVKTKDGDMSFGEGTKLPEEWPDDVPVYKGLKLISAMKTKEGFSIQGTTTDSHDKVAEYYKEQVAKSGWTEDTVMTQPQMAMLTYKKDKRTLAIVISGQNAEISVSITIGNE
jgi:hypothetical protein